MTDEDLADVDLPYNYTLMAFNTGLCASCVWSIYQLPRDRIFAIGTFQVVFTYGVIGVYKFAFGQRRLVYGGILETFNFFIQNWMLSFINLEAIREIDSPYENSFQEIIAILPIALLVTDGALYHLIQQIIIAGNILSSLFIVTLAGSYWGIYHCIWNYYFIKLNPPDPWLLIMNNFVILDFLYSVAGHVKTMRLMLDED